MPQVSFYSVAIFLVVFMACLNALAQEAASPQRSLVRVGIWGHGAWQQHSAQFLGLASAQYPQEPYFKQLPLMRLTANPIQWSAGVLGELSVWEDKGTSLGVAARLGAQALSATFTSSLLDLPIAGLSAAGTLDFTLQTNLLLLNAEPLVQWRFAQNHVALMAGTSFASVFRETTAQRRTLRSSQQVDAAVRGAAEGSEAGLLGGAAFGQKVVSAVVAGVSWEVPITANGAFLLVPEVFYSYGLTDITTNIRAQENQSAFWRTSRLRAGFALKFAPERPPLLAPPPPTPEITPAPALAQTSTASSTASANVAIEPLLAKIASIESVEPDGNRAIALTLKVEEFLASSSRFLLPYIFFDEQSAVLPERYKPISAEERSAFTPEKLINATFAKDHELDVYYHLLNIVGYRMKKYPAARLTLTGYTDVAAESADKTLSLRRAEAVKEYLQHVWEIAASRITAKSGGARGLAETIDAEENRAVEIQSNEPEIFAELRYEYILRTVQPPRVDIEPKISAPKGLSGWSVAIEQEAGTAAPKRYATFEGTAAPNIITWGAERAFASAAPLPEPLRVTLQARDNAGESAQDRVTIPVEVLTVAEKLRRNSPDVRVGTYWVFCFNLNSKQVLVDERIRRAVQGITSYITPGASVEITGYSDTRGNVAKNRKLSDDRAEAVLQLLRVPSSKISNVSGKGESTFYDNDLPEGRFYNRFVRVDVRTPMEGKR